jgi:hypothetical protein
MLAKHDHPGPWSLSTQHLPKSDMILVNYHKAEHRHYAVATKTINRALLRKMDRLTKILALGFCYNIYYVDIL